MHDIQWCEGVDLEIHVHASCTPKSHSTNLTDDHIQPLIHITNYTQQFIRNVLETFLLWKRFAETFLIQTHCGNIWWKPIQDLLWKCTHKES